MKKLPFIIAALFSANAQAWVWIDNQDTQTLCDDNVYPRKPSGMENIRPLKTNEAIAEAWSTQLNACVTPDVTPAPSPTPTPTPTPALDLTKIDKCADKGQDGCWFGTEQERKFYLVSGDKYETKTTNGWGTSCLVNTDYGFASTKINESDDYACYVEKGNNPAPSPAPNPVPVPAPTPTPSPVGLWCNPDMPMMPCVDMDSLPIPKAGSNTLDLRATSEKPTPSNEDKGAVRVVCDLAAVGIFDPILYPGQNGKPHLHLFFGNKGVNPSSTTETLASSGASTCRGGIMNRSSYWVPGMIDVSTKKAIAPRNAQFYYKHSPAQPFPRGLRMIAGNLPTDSTPSNNNNSWFECNEQYASRSKTVPSCPVGGLVTQHITFGDCWDGTNLDSADHRSHMAYSTNGRCPATHPVKVPTLSQFVYYPVTSNTANWRLSSDMYAKNGYNAGYSNHADFMMGWDETLHKVLVDNCINKQLDCHAHLTGDGRMFY